MSVPENEFPLPRDNDQYSDLERAALTAGRQKASHVTPEYINTKVSECNLDDVRGAIKSRMKLRNAHMLTQYSAKIRIQANEPVLAVLFGDQHYGSGDSDHERIERDFALIKNTPGVYAFFMGNLIDNAIPAQFPDGMLQNIIPPEEQVVAMRKMVQELDGAGKVLGAVTCPCHEGWTWKKAGQDINRLMFDYEGRKFPVMENGGKLLLTLEAPYDIPDVTYYFALYHQVGPFNSNFNKSHGPQQKKRMEHANADVVAAAHHHTAEALQTYHGKHEDQRAVAFMRTGCYKLDDQWAGGKGLGKGEPGGQSISLWPGIKRMQPRLEIEAAIEEHQALSLLYRTRRALSA